MENTFIDIPVQTSSKAGSFLLEYETKSPVIALLLSPSTVELKNFEKANCQSFENNLTARYIASQNFSSLSTNYRYYIQSRRLNLINDLVSSMEFVIDTPLLEKDAKQYITLKKEYHKELKKFGHYIAIDDKQKVNIIFQDIAKKIATIPFKDALVELTPNATLKIKIKLSDSKLLIITRALSDSELNPTEVVFTIFQDGECLVSDVKDISELVIGLNEYYNSN